MERTELAHDLTQAAYPLRLCLPQPTIYPLSSHVPSLLVTNPSPLPTLTYPNRLNHSPPSPPNPSCPAHPSPGRESACGRAGSGGGQ